MSNAMPKFDFSGVTLTDDQLNEKIEADRKKEPTFFRPGKYELKVIGSKYKGQSDSDKSWAKWVVEYEGAGGKKITDMLFVPTKSLVFNTKDGKESTFAISRLKGFLAALGETLKVDNLNKLLPVYFGKEDALVGLNLGAEIGYAGSHVKYAGKDEADNVQLVLARKDGTPFDGVPTFSSYDDAHAFAEEKGWKIERFCNVLSYHGSSTPNKKDQGNW